MKLFIACSLDGFIARKDGSVDWLFTDQDYGYKEFYDQIDTILMGRKTYEQVLSFGWPYDKPTYVLSTTVENGEYATFVDSVDKIDLNKRIWVVGGFSLIKTVIDSITDFIISIHPLILGEGIPLFPNKEIELKLVDCTSYPSGLVQVHYTLN